MGPRHQTLPPAQTSSAREALQSFYCQLCSKGYSRMNEYEAHLSSYDHSHKQRLKDMKAMVRDPNAGARARKAEARADGLVSIKLGGPDAAASAGSGGGVGGGGGGGGGGGFKKGGFKKSGFKSAFQAAPSSAAKSASSKTDAAQPRPEDVGPRSRDWQSDVAADESESEDERYDRYDPRNPTH